jgi:TRAP-type C4-dicarboxylate transport system substrate-binding protein
MAPQRKDFIGFMLAAEKDEKMTKAFLAQKDAAELKKFFKKHGFTISEPACKDILKFEEGAKEVMDDIRNCWGMRAY